MMNQELIITIQSLVYGGSGMGRLPDGRAAFVPFTLPGETARIAIREEKKGFVNAQLLEILQPSPLRISPRCRHFGECGGCHYQHLSYEQQLVHKKEILIEQLQRIGGVEHPVISQEVPSPQAWNYRNSLQFHLSPQGRLGFDHSRSNQVLEILECHLPLPALNETWPSLDFEYLPEIERVELRQGDGDQLLLALHSENASPPEFETELPLSAVHVSPHGQIVLAGDDSLAFSILASPFRVNAASFFQVNASVAEKMVSLLLEKAGFSKKSVVLDVFCGVGLFSFFAAPLVGRCLGVEAASVACRDYAFNLDALDNVSLYEGTAETILPLLAEKPDLVILDPPRSGVDHRALQALLRWVPEQVVYFSCNPATLARDARHLLSRGYELAETILLDMFPQTFHIESMNIFEYPKKG
jgi:23S rRNA (uracil1939-C5)-methyltransferase